MKGNRRKGPGEASALPGWGAAVVATSVFFAGLSRADADEDRFTLLGWVKQGLTPEEEARSASRASRLRPIATPVPATPEVSSVAASAPAVPIAPPPVPSRPPASSSQIASPPPGPVPAPVSAPPVPSNQVRRGPPAPPTSAVGPATVGELRKRAEYLATRGLSYQFGGDHPSEGGMDCSGTMQFLLQSIGYRDIPRTSYDQFGWLKEKGTLRKVGFFHGPDKAVRQFRPGDLIFWGGTYNSGHKVSHVMVYLGQSRGGKHYVFGARGKKVKGLNGNGVDIFEFRPESTGGKLVGYGPLPGLSRN